MYTQKWVRGKCSEFVTPYILRSVMLLNNNPVGERISRMSFNCKKCELGIDCGYSQ